MSGAELNQDTVKQLTQALQTVYNSGSQPQARKQAQQYLEFFKANGTNHMQYAMYFMQKHFDDSTRHFGLHLVETVIDKTWEQMDQMTRDNVANLLMSFAKTGTRGFTEEKSFVKEKLGSLITSVIKREWPQRMPSLFDKVIELASAGQTQCEITLITIRTLMEDVSDEFAGNIDVERRNDLIKNLKAQMDNIFKFLFNLLDKFYQKLVEARQQKNRENLMIYGRLVPLLFSITFAMMNDWIPVKSFFMYKFHSVWCTLLSDNDFRMDAAKALHLLAEYKWKDVEDAINFISIFGVSCQSLVRFNSMEHMEENYDFYKALAQIITSYGVNTAIKLLNKRQHAKYMEGFCDMLLVFSRHPSYNIFDTLSNVWVKLLFKSTKKEENPTKDTEPWATVPFFQKYFSPLIEVTYSHSLREVANPSNEKFSNHPANKFAEQDFDEPSMYTPFFGQYRSKISSLITSLAGYAPSLAATYAAKQLVGCFAIKAADPKADATDKNGCIAYNSPSFVTWEGASFFFGSVMDGITESDPKILEILATTWKGLIEFSSGDPILVSSSLDALKRHGMLFRADAKYLQATLKKLFDMVCFRLPSEKGIPAGSLSADTLAARRSSLSGIITICKSHSKVLLPLLKPLVSQTEALWKQKEIQFTELMLLYEAVVIISNQMGSAEQQAQFFDYLLNSPKNELLSQPLTQFVNSEVLVLKSLNLIDEANTTQKAQLIEAREKIKNILKLFHSIARRSPSNPQQAGYVAQDGSVKYPIGPYLLAILPNVMALTRVLHVIYTPNVLQQIPKQKHIGLVDYSFSSQYTGVLNIPEDLKQIHSQIQEIRTLCYQIMGQACKYADPAAFWGNPQLFKWITNSIFSFLEHIENRALTAIFNEFLDDFIKFCPRQMWNSMLLQTLTPLYALVLERLTSGWSKAFERSNGTISTGSEREEVIEERILRELTSVVLAIPLEHLSTLEKHAKEKAAKPTPLAQLFTECDNLLFLWIMISIRMLGTPDSAAASKAVRMLHILALVPRIVSHQKYQTVFGGEVLQAALRALMAFKEDLHAPLVNLVTDIYHKYNTISPLPKKILKELPANFSESKINSLTKQINSGNTKQKEKRQTMRKFLKPILGVHSGQVKRSVTILKVPDLGNVIRNNMMEGTQFQSLVDQTDSFEIAGLFSG